MTLYYDHGGITIFHGDCREILPELPKVDLVLTDPPYGVDLEYGKDTDDSFEAWKERTRWLIPALKNAGKTVFLSTSKIEGEAFIYKEFMPSWRICWYKGATTTRCAIGWKDWEPIFVWGSCGPCHDHFMASPEHHASVFREKHPCPKPLKWAQWLLKKAAPKSQTILDPFVGTGTTLRAAKDLGRRAIGIEIEEKYCEIAANRLSQEVFDFE